MRGEWGSGKTPFPITKHIVRVKGGYTFGFFPPLGLFLISYVFMSKGCVLFLRETLLVVVGIERGVLPSGKSFSQLTKHIRNPFPTLSHDFSHFYKIWLF